VLGPVSERTRLVVTHGGGPYGDGNPHPLDVLDAESGGQIGHVVELELGAEAVVDEDLASALLAVGLDADVLVLATDVDAVYTDWGTPRERAVTRTSPAWLRAQSFASGSMAPKVEAVCRFVEATGKRAAIGRLADIPGLIDGTAGTQIGGDHAHELARLRDEEDRDLFAIRKVEERMDLQERELASKLRALGKSEARAERSIEQEWRREHFGHDPERTPAWRTHR
jgi:Amino acid kinase family